MYLNKTQIADLSPSSNYLSQSQSRSNSQTSHLPRTQLATLILWTLDGRCFDILCQLGIIDKCNPRNKFLHHKVLKNDKSKRGEPSFD